MHRNIGLQCLTARTEETHGFQQKITPLGGKIQVLCDHCWNAETIQFYTDVTVMIDCALAARDYRSKMTVLAPQIKTHTLLLGFLGLKAMAE